MFTPPEQLAGYRDVTMAGRPVTSVTGKADASEIVLDGGQCDQARGESCWPPALPTTCRRSGGCARCGGRTVVHCPYCHDWELLGQPLALLILRPADVFFGLKLAHRFAERREAGWRRWFAANQIQPWEVVHEDLARDRLRVANRVLEFLRLPLLDAGTLPPVRYRRQADSLTDHYADLVRSAMNSPGSGPLPGAGWRAVTVDGLAVEAGDLAGAVGVDGELPAEFVQDDVVMPVAVVLEVGETRGAALFAVGHVVGFALGGGLVTAAQAVAATNPNRAMRAGWLTARVEAQSILRCNRGSSTGFTALSQ
jgi:hypothetical protein